MKTRAVICLLILVTASVMMMAAGEDKSRQAAIRFAAEFLNRVVHQDFERSEQMVDPNAIMEVSRQIRLADQLIRGREPRSAVPFFHNQLHLVTGPRPGDIYRISFQLEYPDCWVHFKCTVLRNEQEIFITDLETERLSDSLDRINTVQLHGRPWYFYLVMALALAIPLTIIAAELTCIFTKGLPRKWLWIIFIAMGVFRLRINWTTGELDLSVLNIALLGVGYFKSAYSPLFIYLGFPLGAVIFFMDRYVTRKKERAGLLPDSAASAD